MKLDELKQLVRDTDPSAVLVSARLLNRIWKAEFNVPYLLVKAPHDRCYFFDRQTLFRHVDQDELELEPDRLLPAKVIVLIKPTTEELQNYDRDSLLLKYWRLLFHARIHLALDHLRQEGKLTEQEIRQRIASLGPTTFREIKSVLRQEHYLLPPEDDAQAYCEFVAVYQELRLFRSNLRSTYFPSLTDLAVVDSLVDKDLEAATIFRETRLPGAPEPVVRTDTSSDESHDFYWRLMHQADKLAKDGNTVRAAIVRTTAGRVAPAALTDSTREAALGELQRLTQRMQNALKLSDEQTTAWLQVLPALLDKADQGSWPDEAKLLYDLQQSCVEFEKKTFSVDLVDWAFSLGRRPIKRPLPGLQLVRITKHLRNAAKRLTLARISDKARQRLAQLMQEALDRSEEQVRERFRPVLNDAFQDVGLVATNPPEEVALRKVVEELLDRLNEFGFITFSDLRDTLARNQLKMPDLPDPHAYWLGDPLVRLDRRLAAMMDGVYRRSELYLRWLERSSSLLFATHLGRLLTLHVLIPLGIPLLLFWGLYHTLNDRAKEQQKAQAPTAQTAPRHDAPPTGGEQGAKVPATTSANIPTETSTSESLQLSVSLTLTLSLVSGFFLWVIMHVPLVRQTCWRLLVLTWQGLRLLFLDLPRWLGGIPWVHRLVRSWPFLLFHWYIFKPLLFSALIWLLIPEKSQTWEIALVVFLVVDIAVNSRFGLVLTEAYTEAFALAYHWLRFDFLQGLFRWTIYIFKRLNDGVEYILYSVDEWLRFKSGESGLTLVLRAILGVIWFPIGYFTRLYYLLFIESNLNPIKLTISSLSAKVVYPVMVIFLWRIPGAAQYQEKWENKKNFLDFLDKCIAGKSIDEMLLFLFIAFTLFMSPGICSFFVWEMVNNWRLFRANRAKKLKPVILGKHGETMHQYLKPGFHSGTIPRLYAQLRKAEWRAYRTGQWRPARMARAGLKEVAHSLQVFMEREFLTLLQLSPTWGQQPVRVEKIDLASTHLRIELAHMDHPGEPMCLQVEERCGWIVCSLPSAGWLRHVTPLQLQVMSSALAGLYKIIGADFVREQLHQVLHVPPAEYEFTPSRLLVWQGPREGEPLSYPLRRAREVLKPHGVKGELAAEVALQASEIHYQRLRLGWEQWVECWQRDGLGQSPACLLQPQGWHLLPAKVHPAPPAEHPQKETVRLQEETVTPLREPVESWRILPSENGAALPTEVPAGTAEKSEPALADADNKTVP